ncbi:MAG: hypothetical protein FJ146_05365 [Deltaproteobacteria bacterium]|nr:hypothetical protein [Deltaproteobacteria bacterium]
MKPYFRLVIASVSLFFGLTALGRTPDKSWQHSGEIDGVAVYSKASSEAGVTEFLSSMVVPSDMATTAATLIEGSNFANWIEGCVESQEIERKVSHDPKTSLADQFNVIYGINKAPWPLSKRDFAVKAVMNIDREKPGSAPQIVFKAVSVDDKVPVKSEYVRVKKMVVNIRLTPVDGNDKATEVEFGLAVDPNVDAPKAIQEGIARENPPKSLLRLKKFLEAPKFDPKLADTIRERLRLLK